MLVLDGWCCCWSVLVILDGACYVLNGFSWFAHAGWCCIGFGLNWLECWFVMVDVRRCWTHCWMALMVVVVAVLFGWCLLVGDDVLVSFVMLVIDG